MPRTRGKPDPPDRCDTPVTPAPPPRADHFKYLDLRTSEKSHLTPEDRDEIKRLTGREIFQATHCFRSAVDSTAAKIPYVGITFGRPGGRAVLEVYLSEDNARLLKFALESLMRGSADDAGKGGT